MRIEGGTVTVVEEAPLTSEEAQILLHALQDHMNLMLAECPDILARLERIAYPVMVVEAEPGVVPRIVTEP